MGSFFYQWCLHGVTKGMLSTLLPRTAIAAATVSGFEAPRWMLLQPPPAWPLLRRSSRWFCSYDPVSVVSGLEVGGRDRRTLQHAQTTPGMRGTCLVSRTKWNKDPIAAQSTAESTRRLTVRTLLGDSDADSEGDSDTFYSPSATALHVRSRVSMTSSCRKPRVLQELNISIACEVKVMLPIWRSEMWYWSCSRLCACRQGLECGQRDE